MEKVGASAYVIEAGGMFVSIRKVKSKWQVLGYASSKTARTRRFSRQFPTLAAAQQFVEAIDVG